MVRRSINLAIIDVVKNPLILIPLLIQIFLSAITFVLFFGLASVSIATIYGLDLFDPQIATFLLEPTSLLVLGLFAIMCLCVWLFIAAYFDAGFYSLIKEGMHKKPTSKQFFLGAKKHFKSYLSFLTLKYALLTTALVSLIFLWWLVPVLAIIWLLLILIIVLFFSVAFLFAPMHIVQKNLSGINAFTQALRFSKKYLGTTMLAVLVITCTLIIIGFVMFAFQSFFAQNTIITSVLEILSFVTNLFVALFIAFFLFRIFESKEKTEHKK